MFNNKEIRELKWRIYCLEQRLEMSERHKQNIISWIANANKKQEMILDYLNLSIQPTPEVPAGFKIVETIKVPKKEKEK
jgi:hypothetical protein